MIFINHENEVITMVISRNFAMILRTNHRNMSNELKKEKE